MSVLTCTGTDCPGVIEGPHALLGETRIVRVGSPAIRGGHVRFSQLCRRAAAAERGSRMRFKRFAVILSCTIMLAVVPLGQAWAGPSTWTVKQITFDAGRKLNLQISGNRLVWMGYDGSNWQEFTWASGDSTPTQITSGAHYHGVPCVSGDRVAWTEADPADSVFQHVFTWKAGDATPTQVTSGNRIDYLGGVSGDRVLWLSDLSSTQRELFTWKAGDSSPLQITTGAGVYGYWMLSGSRVIWRGWDSAESGGRLRLFTWTVGDSAPSQVTTPGATDVVEIGVSVNRFVWTQECTLPWPYSGSGRQVFTAKVGDTAPTQVTSDLLRTNTAVQVSSDRLVWQDSSASDPYPTSHRVLTWQPGDATATVLGIGGSVRVSGDRVMWSALVGTANRFVNWSVGDATPTVLPFGSNSTPLISGNRVAWCDTLGSSVEVFTAVNETDTTPPSTDSDVRPDYSGPASIHLAASDNVGGSGVAHTYYKLDSGVQVEGTIARVTGIGAHVLEFWSVDAAGNIEVRRTTAFRVSLPKAAVYTPVAPSAMYRGHSYTIYGYVVPRHTSGTYLATLKFYLRNSHGVYVFHNSVNAKRYYYSTSRTKYSARLSLPHAGKWRVRAYHSCSKHSGSYSGYDYITVK